MILISPIVKKEIEVRSRRTAFTIGLVCFIFILFLLSITASARAIAAMNEVSEPRYGLLLRVYDLMALIVYIMLLLIAPLFTVSAISREREAGTLDLLLTTRLSPLNIVLEKFISAFLSVMVLLFAALPPLLVPLMFGGVEAFDAVRLLLSYIPGIYLIMSVGLFMSALQDSTLKSIAVTYGILLIFTAGLVLIPVIVLNFDFLSVFDPLAPAVDLILSQTSRAGLFSAPILISFAFGILLGSALILLSSRFVMRD